MLFQINRMVNLNVEVNTVVSHQPGPILESIMLNCQTFQISGLKYTTRFYLLRL